MFRPPPNPHHNISAAKPKQLPLTFDLRKKKEKKEITERKRNKNRWLVFGRICLFEVKYLTLNVLQHDTGRVLMDLWRVGTISLAPPSSPPLLSHPFLLGGLFVIMIWLVSFKVYQNKQIFFLYNHFIRFYLVIVYFCKPKQRIFNSGFPSVIVFQCGHLCSTAWLVSLAAR